MNKFSIQKLVCNISASQKVKNQINVHLIRNKPSSLRNRQRKGSQQDWAIDATSTSQTWVLLISSLREEEVLMDQKVLPKGAEKLKREKNVFLLH